MQSMDNELMRLYREGKITADDAYMKANVKKEFEEIYTSKKESDESLYQNAPIDGGGREEDALSMPFSPAEQEAMRQRRQRDG